MKKEQLIDALGQMDDDMVQRVDALRQRKRKPLWVKWGAIAACLCLALGLYAALRLGLPPAPGAASGGGGGEGITYMSYAGPVFPLTALENADGITVQRNVDYDFSPYQDVTYTHEDADGSFSYESYATSTIVTDYYTLTNESEQAQTMTLLYPFAATLRSELPVCPEITAGGKALAPELYIGPYSGGFEGAWGGGGERLNLAQLNSWEQYQALLSDGKYRDDALSAFPKLNQPVVVYELSDRRAPAETENPDIVVEMNIAYDKTTVLSYGFNSGRSDVETGLLARGTHVPKSNNPDYGESAYLVILGDEPNTYTLTGYRDGGWEQEDAAVTADVKRYESTLGEMLRILSRIYFERISGVVYDDDDADVLMRELTEEQMAGVVAEHLLSYGLLSQSVTERYDSGMLEEIMGDVYMVQRVLYLRFELTIPAGESMEVSACMDKEASIDFIGKKRSRNGYDMVTQLGSNLTFSGQSASVSNTAYIEMLDQNFGFDIANGITRVDLNPAQAHYWMEVQKRKS